MDWGILVLLTTDFTDSFDVAQDRLTICYFGWDCSEEELGPSTFVGADFRVDNQPKKSGFGFVEGCFLPFYVMRATVMFYYGRY